MPPTTNEPTLTHLSSEEDEPMETLSDGTGIADESPKYDFFQERKTDLEIVKRLQASTARLNLAEVYVASFVGLIEDIAHEQNCQTKFVSTLLPPTLATAMGPRVRVSAWHSGEHGWIEVGNAPWFLAAPSGTGKTNAARAVKKAVVQLEKTCDIRVLSTGFTNSAIKTRMHEHGQAFAILEEGSKLRDSLGQFTGGAGADRAEMLELMDGAYIVDDRKGGSGKGAKDSKEGDDAGDEAVEQEKTTMLKTQSFVANFNIAGLVHSHRVLEWVRSDKSKTDGFQERIPTAHCTGKAMQLPDRATLIKTAEERESKGELWVLLVLVRIFCDEYLYKGRSESSLAYGLIELGDEAYVIFQAYYDKVGATIDELSAVAEGGGDIAVSSKSRGKALLNSALIALARICMSAYSNEPINAAFKSKLTTDPAGMTYGFMHATVHSFFTEIIASAPDEHHCRLINKGDIEGAIILAKYGVAQHQLASNRWIKVLKVAGSAAAMASQLEAASPGKLPASSLPKETEKKKKLDVSITATDMQKNFSARHDLYAMLNPLPPQHAAAIVQAAVNVLRQEKSEPFVLSCSYASQMNVGRVGVGEPTKSTPRGGKLSLSSKSPMQSTMRGGVADCFAKLHLAKFEEEEVSSEQASLLGIGSRKKSRFYIVFLNIEELIAASATPEVDRKGYDCMLALFKLDTLVYHQLMTTHLIDFANLPSRLANSEADARGKYGRISALPTPAPAAAEAPAAPEEASWEEDELTTAVRAAAINKADGDVDPLDLSDSDFLSVYGQMAAEDQAQGLAEDQGLAQDQAQGLPMPPPPPQGGTATKRGRSANASASSSPAVTAPKRPTSLFGNWMSNAFGLSTPAQSPAAGVPLPPPLPGAGAILLPASAAGAASE